MIVSKPYSPTIWFLFYLRHACKVIIIICSITNIINRMKQAPRQALQQQPQQQLQHHRQAQLQRKHQMICKSRNHRHHPQLHHQV